MARSLFIANLFLLFVTFDKYVKHLHVYYEYQFRSFTQSCLILCDPMDCNIPGLPVYHQLQEITQTHVHRVGDAMQQSHPLGPLLLLPSIFPSFKVFSDQSVPHIRWPKYWSFSFSISPSNEYSGLISFRMDLLEVQGTLESLPTSWFKNINFLVLSFLYSATVTTI